MAGRGSFIESFPLFGYDLDDYDELFAEKLELLLELRERTDGHLGGPPPARRSTSRGVYPRPLQDPLPIWIAVGGTPQSVGARRHARPAAGARDHRRRAGRASSRSSTSTARRRARAGHDPATLPIGDQLARLLADTAEQRPTPPSRRSYVR